MSDQLADAIASSIGGVVTVTTTYPIEIIKNRIASASNESQKDTNGDAKPRQRALSVASSIYKQGGILGFYDGVTVSSFENAIEKFCYFYVYTAARRRLQAIFRRSSMAVDLAAGIVAEICHLPITIPLDTLLIKVVNNPKAGVAQIVRSVLAEKGFTGLYAGAMPSLLLSLKPAIQLVVFEAMKKRYLQAQMAASVQMATLSAGTAFVFGAIARAVSTLIVFPYMRAKFMLKNMSSSVDSGAKTVNPLIGMHLALLQVAEQQGLQGLYSGLSTELMRGVSSAALLMAVRERLTVRVMSLLKK